jgi:ribosomal protein S18 acetylase RimI-like enzyme
MTHTTTLPPGYMLRRAVASDAPAIQALLNACESADCSEDRQVDFEIGADLLDPDIDVEQDWFPIVDQRGEPAAFGAAYCASGAEPFTNAFVGPAHRGRGLSAAVLELAERRVRQRLADGTADRPSLLTVCEDTKTRRIAWLGGRGYRRVRDSYAMRIDLSQGFASPSVPAGIDMREARLPDDERAAHAADVEAYVDHFGYYPMSFAAWKSWYEAQPEFDPALWLIAWDGSEVAGQVVGAVRGDAAYVGSVAVRKPWRGHGLALALLLEEFARFYARGRDDVYLFVDAYNPTGAVRLYEKAGMTIWRRFGEYRLELND